jgi:hypothetical protein
MNSISCGTDEDFPDTDGACCMGSAMRGPGHCTCWQPVYDLEQQPLDQQARRWLAAGVEPVTRTRMCLECAYRPGSPEKTGAQGYNGDADELDRIAGSGDLFWCHEGMRKPLKFLHPSGVEFDGHPAGYDPPIMDGVPYRADGTPGELCAGWDARRRALAARVNHEAQAPDPSTVPPC